MQLNFHQSIYTQINQYLVDTDNINKSAREFDSDFLYDFVHSFIKGVDYGEHTNNSESHKVDAYIDIAQNILNNLDIYNIIKADNILEINRKFLNYTFNYRYKCQYCDQYFKTALKEDLILRPITSEIQGRFGVDSPPHPRCYKDDKVVISITMKSNKFIIANDLRNILLNKLDFLDSINSPLGRIKSTEYFAENNVMCIPAGNCTMSLYQKDDIVITDMYYDDLDEYCFSDLKQKLITEVNTIIDNGYKNISDISCSLWWLMGASLSDVDISKLENWQDYIILDVVEGANYIIEYDSKYNSYYRFYKSEE